MTCFCRMLVKQLIATCVFLSVFNRCVVGLGCYQDDPEKETPQYRTASGTVFDAEGNPVPKAMVCHDWYDDGGRKSVLRKTDKDGKYSMTFKSDRKYDLLHTWVYAKGHGVRCVMMKSVFKNGVMNAKDVEIRLPKNETYEIQLKGPDGVAFKDCRVRIGMADVPNGKFASDDRTGLINFVPEPLASILESASDANGTVKLNGIPRKFVYSFDAISPDYGTQSFHRAGVEETVFQLVEVGAIEGVIHAKNLKDFEDMKIYFESSTIPAGKAIAIVDSEGKFNVPALAPGRLIIDVAWPKGIDIYPLLDGDYKLEAGMTLKIESQSDPAKIVKVSGRVVTEDTKQPVVGATVHFGDRRGRSGADATTDEEGRFTADVCEGSAFHQVTSLGKGRGLGAKYDYPKVGSMMEIPSQDTFELPDIFLTRKPRVNGVLLDSDDKPMVGVLVAIARNSSHHTYGQAKTDADGSLKWSRREGGMQVA